MRNLNGFLPKKYLYALVAIVLLGAVLWTINDRAKETPQTTQVQADDETRLAQVLSQIDGAGQVQVMITYASGPEIVPASVSQINTSRQQTGEDSSSHTSSSRSEPASSSSNGTVVLKELSPQIKGVVVIAQGADTISVKMDLLQATVTVLQIKPEQVDVFTMKEE